MKLVNKYKEVAYKYTPANVKIQWVNSLAEMSADTRTQEIAVCKPESCLMLLAYLHEIGHIHYQHKVSDIMHFREYQATKYAVEILQYENIDIQPTALKQMKFLIAEYVYFDYLNGVPIHTAVQEYISDVQLTSSQKQYLINKVFYGDLINKYTTVVKVEWYDL